MSPDKSDLPHCPIVCGCFGLDLPSVHTCSTRYVCMYVCIWQQVLPSVHTCSTRYVYMYVYGSRCSLVYIHVVLGMYICMYMAGGGQTNQYHYYICTGSHR